MFAIAAISRNGIIGNGNTIPWRISEEFKWFRRMTMGSVVIMGRRTFESLPRPLEGRVNVVLTRHPRQLLTTPGLSEALAGAVEGAAAHSIPVAQLGLPTLPRTEVRLARDLQSLVRAGVTDRAWLIGGAQVYEQFLGYCSELYLSVIDRDVEGDVRFPEFKHLFDLDGVVAEFSEFRVLKYVRNSTDPVRLPRPRREARRGPRASPGTGPQGPAPSDDPPESSSITGVLAKESRDQLALLD